VGRSSLAGGLLTIAVGRGVPEPTQVADSLTPANVMITFVPAPPTITVPRSLAVTRLVSLVPLLSARLKDFLSSYTDQPEDSVQGQKDLSGSAPLPTGTIMSTIQKWTVTEVRNFQRRLCFLPTIIVRGSLTGR